MSGHKKSEARLHLIVMRDMACDVFDVLFLDIINLHFLIRLG